MKTLLLFLSTFLCISVFGQTTYNLNWHLNFTSPATDLSINVGDTVIWTWTDSFSHTVQNNTGSTETFNSGVLNGVGQTYSHTFTAVGANPYFCGVHGAGSMSGTITVASLAVQGFNDLKGIAIYPNPVADFLIISNVYSDIQKINIFDFSGKRVMTFSKFEEQKNIKIGVSTLENGSYIIEIETNKGKINKKFIKQ